MNDALVVIMNLSVLVFVITSMLAMGLSLTVAKIIKPLKNTRLVILALIANFILVPLLALLILQVIPLETGLATGLIIMATAAGAPFLPKLAQTAKGNVAFSVGLMVLLMVITVVYLPLVLPLLLPGVEVDAMGIARSLVIMMLTPLAIGLFVNSRYQATAKSLYPHMSQASSVGLIMLIVSGLLLGFSDIIGVIGTGTILAIAIFLVVGLLIGYLLAGKEAGIKSVLGLGTAQRNLSAAFLVAIQNFGNDPNVLVMIMVTGLLGLVLLMFTAGELGKQS